MRSFQAEGAIDDHELGPLQAAGIENGEELAPGRRAFASDVANGKQQLSPAARRTPMAASTKMC